MFKLSNIKKSPLTTIIGIVVIVTSIVSVFTHNMNWTEAAVGIVLGAAFMGIKDPRMSNTVPVILFVAAGICYVGCSRRLVQIGTNQTDSTWTKTSIIHDTVTLPGEVIEITVPCPEGEVTTPGTSTKKADGKVYKTKGKKATATATVQPDGKVKITCACDSENVVLKSKLIEVGRQKTKTITLAPEKIYKTYWYDYVCRFFAVLFVILLLILWLASRISIKIPSL